jgi:hypothetical protein
VTELKIEPDRQWYCPLLNAMIEEGRCLDINYQRVGLFTPDALAEAMAATGLTVEGVSAICTACPNQPLAPEDYEALLVGGRPIH